MEPTHPASRIHVPELDGQTLADNKGWTQHAIHLTSLSASRYLQMEYSISIKLPTGETAEPVSLFSGYIH